MQKVNKSNSELLKEVINQQEILNDLIDIKERISPLTSNIVDKMIKDEATKLINFYKYPIK